MHEQFKWTALQYASYWGFPSHVIQYLLNRGADPNVQDGHGNTALHLLIKGGKNCHERVHLLIAANADCSLRNLHGHTAFDLASDNAMLLNAFGGGACVKSAR